MQVIAAINDHAHVLSFIFANSEYTRLDMPCMEWEYHVQRVLCKAVLYGSLCAMRVLLAEDYRAEVYAHYPDTDSTDAIW